MRFFVKWGMWIAIIAIIPITFLVTFKTGGILGVLLGMLAMLLMLLLSDIFGQRHYALCEGVTDIDTLNKKLAEGADINAKGACCHRPLTETIEKSNDINLIKTMIQKGARVNVEGDGKTPLGIALSLEKYEIAKLLINSGVVITDDAIKNCIESLNRAVEEFDSDEIKDKYARTIIVDKFAKTFKLYLECNVNLENFWKYFDEDLKKKLMKKYPKVLKYVDDNPKKDTKLINLLMDGLLKDNEHF